MGSATTRSAPAANTGFARLTCEALFAVGTWSLEGAAANSEVRLLAGARTVAKGRVVRTGAVRFHAAKRIKPGRYVLKLLRAKRTVGSVRVTLR